MTTVMDPHEGPVNAVVSQPSNESTNDEENLRDVVRDDEFFMRLVTFKVSCSFIAASPLYLLSLY